MSSARYLLLGTRALWHGIVTIVTFAGALFGAGVRIVVGFTLIPLYKLYHGFKSKLFSGTIIRASAITFRHVLSHSSNSVLFLAAWIGIVMLAFSATASAHDESATLLLESLDESDRVLIIETRSTGHASPPEQYPIFVNEPHLSTADIELMASFPGVDDHGIFIAEHFDSVETLPTTRTGIETYLVQDGDTLSGIAERFGLNLSTVLWANGLSDRSILKPNTSLTILPTNGVLYTIAKGDTISKIAKRYGITEESVRSFKTDGDTVIPGTNIILPDAKPLRFLAQASTNASAGSRTTANVPPPKRTTASGFIWPTPGRKINQYFSWRHNGLDIDNRTDNDPIYASESGTVLKAGWNNGGYGNRVLIQHAGNQQTNYGHLKKVLVKAGEKVQKGDVIGIMGTTGRSTGVHLHFEIIINGRFMNPLSYVQ